MPKNSQLLTGAVLCAAVVGCASTEDVRALRRPQLPPTQIALADARSPAFQKISIYEVLGAPEFRVIDGENDTALISTRPTRADVTRAYGAWLAESGLLAPSLANSRFLLNVTFDELHGPDVIPFSDKEASAVVRFQLVERVSRQVVFDKTYSAELRVRMPGVTPEMERAAVIAGLTAGIIGYSVNDASSSGMSNATAAWLGHGVGALAGAVAAAPHEALQLEHWDDQQVLGAFDGTDRRRLAVYGMLNQSFGRFLFDLEAMDWVQIREAVTCASLNPNGLRGPAYLTMTTETIAYDCPVREIGSWQTEERHGSRDRGPSHIRR